MRVVLSRVEGVPLRGANVAICWESALIMDTTIDSEPNAAVFTGVTGLKDRCGFRARGARPYRPGMPDLAI